MIEFKVKDMSCSHCASTITAAVKGVDARAECEIDIEAKRVRITSALRPEEFADSIRKAGFTPVPAG
jgi:copper chaperone